jgi:hypothetical protein
MILLAGTVLALLAVLLVLEPLVRPVAPAAIARPDSDDDDITPEQRRRDLALAALKEIEFDQATGKLSDADYERLYQRYAAEAVEALKAGDRGTGVQGDGKDGGEAVSVPPSPRPPVPRRFCEECGSPLEGSGKFCSECGTRVAA